MRKQKQPRFCKFVSLRDRCLIIFMIVFIIQSIIAVFFRHTGGYVPGIDMVARTTMAAIFGYFISSNFMSKEYINTRKKQNENKKVSCTCKLEENKDGDDDDDDEMPVGQKTEDRIQIMIVTFIGLVSLFILFFSRYLVNTSEDVVSIISQYRGFLSGCIGFLLGIPPEKKYK